MLKTIEQWFLELPQPIQKQAIENLVFVKKGIKCNKMSEAIKKGFVWEYTPKDEGFDYWENIWLSYAEKRN